MKHTLSVLLFFCFALCIAATSDASEMQIAQSGDFKLLPASKALQVSGTVKSVNESAGTIAVTKIFRDKTIEVTVVTDKGTKIAKGSETKNLYDIKAGDKIVVVYDKKGEMNLAKSIMLQ